MSDQRTPDTLEQTYQRVYALQEPLKEVLDLADDIFALHAPDAVHPKDADNPNIYFVQAMGDERFGRTVGELTLKLDEGDWLRIFKMPDDPVNFPSYPHRMLWHFVPIEDGLNRKTTIKHFTHPRSIERNIAYDIDTSIWEGTSMHLGFVGESYKNKEPFIEEATTALKKARLLR